MVLTISDRRGETFKGEMSVRREGADLRTHNVSGTAKTKASGPVAFESEKVGVAQVKLRGKLLNDVAILSSSDTGPRGRKTTGEFHIRPKLR
ncbi:hypothetical protein [Planctomyces sp. SH-PL14]|uniref:hypothetical protein n=1 Tax=Planctomyces sp. SH-PL14 TaxID=1632864 RepID=UPI00094617E9|nr:hypothetical protein [Planctomyces sp. SH-PL14]